MYCPYCKIENSGNYCQKCGKDLTQIQTQPTLSAKKKKKPFFLRWYFILIVVIVIGVVAVSVGGGGEKIVWNDMDLGNMLPEPPASKGKIYENSDDELWIDINKVSDKQYSEYVKACKEKGFTVDGKKDSYSYNAFDADGYSLEISHHGEKSVMTIELNEPLKMKTIKWPTSKAGKMLPAPKSKKGLFSHEYDDNFFVYIGNTSKADYDKYVNACAEKGFDVDYNKGDDYYHADNSDGWNLSLRYIGNNTMSIDIDAPIDDDVTEKPIVEKTKPAPTEKGQDTTKKEPVATKTNKEKSDTDSGDLNPDFKSAMDSYENFMDEYVAFMKKYKENPSNLELLADYADYMSKYANFVKDFEKWEDEELNTAEMAYYIDVQARVSKKLLEVTN